MAAEVETSAAVVTMADMVAVAEAEAAQCAAETTAAVAAEGEVLALMAVGIFKLT